MGIARFYQGDRNSGDAALAGVPLDDIDDEMWARLPPWIQASVDNWTVDGRKVYLMSHRTAAEPEPESQAEVSKPKSKSSKAVTPPPEDEPVAVVHEPEPVPEETPADESLMPDMAEGMV